MYEVVKKTKRNFKTKEGTTLKTRNNKKKDLREARKMKVKDKVEDEDRTIIPTNRNHLKKEY